MFINHSNFMSIPLWKGLKVGYACIPSIPGGAAYGNAAHRQSGWQTNRRGGITCALVYLNTLLIVRSAWWVPRQRCFMEQENAHIYLVYLPGVATPVLSKHLCSHGVSRTSVLEETHPRLFQSLQTILETVHGTCIHCVMIQTVPSVD